MPEFFVPALSAKIPFPEPRPGASKPESTSSTVSVIDESTELKDMSLRMYAAIHLRVSDSGIEWLDEMIRRSRELDARSPGKQASAARTP